MSRWLVCLVVFVACGDGAPERPALFPLTTDGPHLRDADGRVALLRGINARVEGVFDVTFDDGRTALEPVPPLTDDDCMRMRAMGFNLLRLPVNWSGIEPQPGSYDEAYLQRIDDAVACAARWDIFVLIDFHQDAYSKEIGEDGAPLWAIVPPPDTLLEGPLDDLERRRTSEQVERAFASFFDVTDAAELQAAFFDMLAVVANRYRATDAVIGFELFNEPVVASDELDPFHVAAAEVIREHAPTKLVFFEPPAIRNFLDFQPLAAEPFPVSGAVYSPHIYTFVFGDAESSLQSLTKADLRSSIDNARAEAEAWGTPLFIGEFGIGPDMTNADLWMQYQSELHDEYFASNAFWLWKEDSQARWGLFDAAGGDWQERPRIVGWVSRIYPQRIAGDPTALSYDGDTGAMTLTATAAGPHVVYVPEAAAASFSATCDGADLAPARDPLRGTIEVQCAGTLVVSPQR